MARLTETHLRRLEATARAHRQSLVEAVEDANNRPGMLGVATLGDAAIAAASAAGEWAAADDQARGGFVEEAVMQRFIDDGMIVTQAISNMAEGDVFVPDELRLSRPLAEDRPEYAATILRVLASLNAIELTGEQRDGANLWRRILKPIEAEILEAAGSEGSAVPFFC